MKPLRFIFVMIVCLCTLQSAWAADGDVFTAKTVEGVDMTFTVISEEKKTCCVDSRAIPVETVGSITIPEEANGFKVTEIGSFAFWNCTGLSSIVIPESITETGICAFSGCSSLTSIVIPDGITIGGMAFENCTSLTSIVIPDGVTIGLMAFSGCTSLSSVMFPDSITEIEIGSGAFYDCTSLSKVIISNIEAWLKISFGDAFANPLIYAKHLYSDENTEITELTIPNCVTISPYAFAFCDVLTSIMIPAGVTSIGEGAFYECRNLTSIMIPAGVTSIGEGAFYKCRSLTSVVIPESVTSIGTQAFYYCSSLKTVNMDEGVTSIGDESFAGCSSLESIFLSSTVTTIDDEAFRHCPSLTSITVDANNQTFDSRNNCNGIIKTAENKLVLGCRNTVIPSSVTSIGEAAFMGSGIINCSIPNGVKTIEETAFYEVENLESLNIPNSVDSIGRECIVRCPNLKTVTIGSGIKVIMNDNFFSCESLKDLYCYAETIPDIRKNNRSGGSYSYYEYPYYFDDSPLFYKTPIDQTTLHVPAASLETYKTTAPWSGFGSIVPLTDEETSIISVINDQKEETFYDLNGREVKTPRKGIYIQNGRKVVR